MHIILIIFGLLLLLFGGGCTLIAAVLMIGEPTDIWNNLGVILPYWIPLGLLPLIVGWLLLRGGIRSRRAKRAEREKINS